MRPLLLAVLLLAVNPASSVFRLREGSFLKLPDHLGRLTYDNGAANKASYDPVEKLLYVIGYRADVLHVVDMMDPSNPTILRTKRFSRVQEGLPDSIKACRGFGREYLAISFEAFRQTEQGHVHFYQFFTRQNAATADLVDIKTPVALDGFDPKDMAWTTSCDQLMVVSEGDPHEVLGVFEDPEGTIERMTVDIGDVVMRTTLSVNETELVERNVRHVFTTCDSTTGDHPMPPPSNRRQDLEPKAVHIASNNVAYVIFQANNAIAKYDLMDYMNRKLEYYDLGTKDWTNYMLDASYEDTMIHPQVRPGVRSLYQPNTLTSFELDGKVWLATADQGSFRRYTLATCRFDESMEARIWRGSNHLSDALSTVVREKLIADMGSTAELGRLRVSTLRSPNDGWNSLVQGYDYVTAYGGRGFSILDADNMNRVYDSGDEFEAYFNVTQEITEQVMFNVKVGGSNSLQTSQRERASPETGQTPSAINAIKWDNSTTVLVVANGIYGGLFVYQVSSGPSVSFQSYSRRGNPGLTWAEAYNNGADVGEPEISDLVYIDDAGQRTLVVVSSKASALSFYTLENSP